MALFIFFPENSAISRTCCYGLTLSSPVSPTRESLPCAGVFQFCPARAEQDSCSVEILTVNDKRLNEINSLKDFRNN